MDELAGAGVTLLPTGTGMKTCTKCGETKPLDQFSKDRRSKDGCQLKCKSCNRAYYLANRERIAKRDEAYRKANQEKIAQRNRAYYEANRERISEQSRAYYRANALRYVERARAYRKANPDKWAEYQRAYRDANRDEVNERVRRYKKANLLKGREWEHRRRARQACSVPQRWQVHDVLPFCCYWCGSNLRAYGATSHVDHVMPISLGGPAVPSNEVMTCATCNLRKSAKHPLVWIAELTA